MHVVRGKGAREDGGQHTAKSSVRNALEIGECLLVETGIEVDQKVQKSMTWVGWGAVSGSLLEPPLRSYYTST